jgi:N-acetylglucosaminyldiphosphoundecaprenol N-acetyl-beta-D-mannosaminyltransferase
MKTNGNHLTTTKSRGDGPTIAIMGVPFDQVTLRRAIERIEEMIASREPHYLVTPNVDFLVQAREDIELRRILCDAHLVLCDGTPLVWASRLLGNPLPERVAGADVVPALLRVAAEKGYRVFLLGATPESAQAAVTKLQAQFPTLPIAGHYSPPFNTLLEMDHAEISRRILAAAPDLLFVSLGCPKQEKWIAMHYRSLKVPVTAGVGATIDFLAGHVRRAPVWMQRSGTEWVFRLLQEPRRLLKRYLKDSWVFGFSLLEHWWQLRPQKHPSSKQGQHAGRPADAAPAETDASWQQVRWPGRLDVEAVREHAALEQQIMADRRHLLLETSRVDFIDSSGVGLLIRLQKKLRRAGRELVLLAPSAALLRALKLMRLLELFSCAPNLASAAKFVAERASEGPSSDSSATETSAGPLAWRGEITAANAEPVWNRSLAHFSSLPSSTGWTIDLSAVRFIDSTGLGLMVRAKKLAEAKDKRLSFVNLAAPVRNVVQLARLETFLLDPAEPNHSTGGGI